MKISLRDRMLLQVAGIVAVTGLTVVTMVYPDLIGYEQSVSSVEDKRSEMDSLNSRLQSNESTLTQENQQLHQQRESLKPLEEEYQHIRERMGETEFNFHLPSLLVALEQNALKHNLTIDIEYQNMQLISTGSQNEEGRPENARPGDEPGLDRPDYDDYDDYEYDDEYGREDAYDDYDPYDEYDEYDEYDHYEDSEPNDELLDDVGQGGDELTEAYEEIENEDSESPERETEEDMAITEATDEELGEPLGTNEGTPYAGMRDVLDTAVTPPNIPQVPGINVTTLPLRLNGDYSDIRSFILYIDEVDFVEHNIVDLYSYGDNVSAIIILNIFHTEDGGGIY